MNSDLSGPTTTAEVICQDYCQNAVSRSDPLQGSDNYDVLTMIQSGKLFQMVRVKSGVQMATRGIQIHKDNN